MANRISPSPLEWDDDNSDPDNPPPNVRNHAHEQYAIDTYSSELLDTISDCMLDDITPRQDFAWLKQRACNALHAADVAHLITMAPQTAPFNDQLLPQFWPDVNTAPVD